jgi:hypothetical protein
VPLDRCYQNERRDQAMPGAPGSARAGTVSGELLFESDPVVAGSAAVDTNRWGWAGVAIALTGLCTLYVSIDPSVFSISLLVASLTMVTYGIRALRTAEFFSTECLFQSTVASLSLEGTYDTARLATAASAQAAFIKQHESLNVDVNVTLICADVVSSVFAEPGEALPFQGVLRHILAFGETPGFADSLVEQLAGKISMQNSLEAIRVSFTGPALPPRNQGALPPTA